MLLAALLRDVHQVVEVMGSPNLNRVILHP